MGTKVELKLKFTKFPWKNAALMCFFFLVLIKNINKLNLLFNPSHISSTPALTSAVQIGNNNRNTEVIVRSIMKKSREKTQRIPNPQTLSSEANVRLV